MREQIFALEFGNTFSDVLMHVLPHPVTVVENAIAPNIFKWMSLWVVQVILFST